MARDDAMDIIEDSEDDIDNMSTTEIIRARIVAVASAIFLVIISAILALGEVAMAPVQALVGGLADVIDATFGESLEIIAAGAQNASTALTEGATAELGVATYPLAIVTVISGLYVLSWAYQRVDWNPIGWITSRRR